MMPAAGIVIRVIKIYDPATNQWRQRVGPVCECGQMMPFFFQITPLPTDWDLYDW